MLYLQEKADVPVRVRLSLSLARLSRTRPIADSDLPGERPWVRGLGSLLAHDRPSQPPQASGDAGAGLSAPWVRGGGGGLGETRAQAPRVPGPPPRQGRWPARARGRTGRAGDGG